MNDVNTFIKRWRLTPNGKPFVTPTGLLLPVRYKGWEAMLKLVQVDEAKAGGQLMVWWKGHGVPQIFAHDDIAILMERALGKRSLTEMAKNHQDSEASSIICEVVAKLHSCKNKPLPSNLIPLSHAHKLFLQMFCH